MSSVEILSEESKPLPSGDATYYEVKFKGYTYGVLVSRDDLSHGEGVPDPRWHLSIRGVKPRRVPPWNALAAITHFLRPGVAFCVPMPPRSQWVNLHEHVLHLWEVHDESLTDQWAFEGQAAHDTPT